MASYTAYLGVNIRVPFLQYASLEKLQTASPLSKLSSPPAQSLSYPRPSDSRRPPYRPTASEHARRVMDDSEKNERNEKASSPLQIDPKWYVQHSPSFASLTSDRAMA